MTAFRFKQAVRRQDTALCGPPHGVFHGHDGNSQDGKEKHIDENEEAASILSCNVRETPHIANANGASCTQ